MVRRGPFGEPRVLPLPGVQTILRKLGSLLPGRDGEQRSGRRVIRPWRADVLRTYPTSGLTPSRMLSLLRQADAGSPTAQFDLFSEMLQKWPRLAAVENTRRLALTGLDWEIEPAPARVGDADAARAAEQAAAFCRETLQSLESFRESLDRLALAIGYGLAVAELVWEDGRLIDLVPAPYSRLAADPNEPWRLRIRTQEDATAGVALDEQPFKWVVHRPGAAPGRHFEGGLLRASAVLYLAQNLSFKDWLVYSQIAGMPVRVARYDAGTSDADRQQLVRMLEALGTDAVAVLSKGVELQFHDAAKTGERPYQPLQDYCNTEVTILWLGQHLTTDLRSEGSRAAAEVHDRVREDLLVHDIAAEARTIRRDVLTPMVRAWFGETVAVPHFRRSLVQSVDTRVLADTLAVAVDRLGIEVPRAWAHQALGIPQPRPEEAVLKKGETS
jgi:phage gp29-like protein